MSGDSGGFIFALIAAPLVIGAAAVGGLAYGAFALGKALVGMAGRYAAKKKEERLKLEGCSAELNALCSRINTEMEQNAAAFAALSKETEKQINVMAEQAKLAAKANVSDLSKLNSQLNKSRKQITETLNQQYEKAHSEIIGKSQMQLNEGIQALNRASAALDEAVNWNSHSEQELQKQREMASGALQDARASVQMIRQMANRSGDREILADAAALNNAYEHADQLFRNGQYQAACSSSRTVVRKTAQTVCDFQLDQMDRDFASMTLQANLRGAIDMMAKSRYIKTEDCEEDLDEFIQGRYEGVQKQLEDMLRKAENATTRYEIDQLSRNYHDTVKPEAEKILETAQRMFAGYGEKIKVLNVVAQFMEQQNFSMDWVAPVGDDLSQKLVVHFKNNYTGSTIAVTLDQQSTNGQMAQMAMDLLTYYGSGNPVTEAQKADLRNRLNQHLKANGIEGALSCSGNFNQPSSKPAYNNQNEVLSEPPVKIL